MKDNRHPMEGIWNSACSCMACKEPVIVKDNRHKA